MRSTEHPSHFAIGILLLTCLICFNSPLRLSSLAQSNDDEAIRKLVERIFELHQQKDIDKLLALWSTKSPFLAENKKGLKRLFDLYEKIGVKGFAILQRRIEGEQLVLRVVAEMALTRAKVERPTERIEKKNRTIRLVKENGIWKVWKFAPSEDELAMAIIAAKTEEEQKALMEKELEFRNSDLAFALIIQPPARIASERGYQHALAIVQLGYRLAEQAGDKYVMAAALIQEGFVYGWVGIPEKSPELSLEYLGKSWKIGEEFGFKEIMVISLGLSSAIYDNLGESSLAIEYLQKSLKLSEGWANNTRRIDTIQSLGVMYRFAGNHAKALELLLKSLELYESRPDSETYWSDRSRSLANICSIFRDQGNDEQALAYCQRAVEYVEKGETLGDPGTEGSMFFALGSLGDTYLSQGKHSLAMECYKKRLKLAEALEHMSVQSKDSFISSVKLRMGDISAAQNNTLQAIASYREALRLAEKAENKEDMASSLGNLSKMYLLLGDHGEALAFADRAIKVTKQSKTSREIYDVLVSIAQIYHKLGKPDDAYQALTRAIDFAEQLRDQLAGGEIDRQRSFENSVTPYQVIIDLQVKQKRFTDAFSDAQRSKGRTLLELLQNGRVNINKSASPAEREQEQQLTRKIAFLNRQITGEKLKSQPDEKRLANFEEQLKRARLEFEAFHTNLYAAHPELKVQRGDIRPVSYDDAESLIPDSKTALLDFIVTDENVHLFVLTKDASGHTALNTCTVKIERKSLAEKVERFRRRMENRDYDFQALSKELYVLLIKPAQKQLQNKSNLIISPDNVLWDLPFQVLLSPELRYLIEDAAISYTPSLSVLREMQLASKKRQPSARASILALGNPALGNRSKELAKFVKMDAELQPLPEAADQVQALGRLYGKSLSQVYTGPTAREELIKEQSARYRILHLATHGILNDASPMYSHVLLSQTPGKSEEDGLLEAWEMMNLDLNADLVVLAACETARGRAGAGEGVIGMSWALFVAGCPRTVVSQWKVEASSTTALMLEFHKRFKTRYGGTRPAVSTAEAMRQAALKVMNNPEYVHPFYWGGFVVVGDGN
jgi:CHAT domain-containing protein/tetratricopeptide (TPR) repeat protein